MDFNGSRQRWHAHIARWGGGVNKGFLVRGTAKRPVTIAMSEYKPTERGLYLDGSVRFWMSALNVQPANIPDMNLDIVEFKKRRYKIIMPPSGAHPDGTWIAFDLNCMYTETVT
jgi:hypothetical protein